MPPLQRYYSEITLKHIFSAMRLRCAFCIKTHKDRFQTRLMPISTKTDVADNKHLGSMWASPPTIMRQSSRFTKEQCLIIKIVCLE